VHHLCVVINNCCWSWLFTSPRSGCIVLHLVCLFVHLSVHVHNSKAELPNFIKFFVHVALGYGSVLLWRCCDTLCTFGFMDDVMFSCHGTYMVECRLLWIDRPTSSQAVLLHAQAATNTTLPGPWLFSRLGGHLCTYVSSQRLWLSILPLCCGHVAACV